MNALLTSAAGNGDVELTADKADAFVELVLNKRYQAIVNLPSYGTDWLGKATIVAAIGQALMRHAEHCRRLGKPLFPCLVIMDEAQLYLPQDQSLLPPEARKNEAVLSALKNAYFALVSNGRSAGYTMGFATQSLTYLAKWAIKSSQVRIFGRHAEKNDLDMCESMIHPAVATRAEIETFPPGVGVVFGFTSRPMIVQFDRKQSHDVSQTPGIERLHQECATQEDRAATPASQRDLILETIVTLSAAGALDERKLMRLVELLPPVRAEESTSPVPSLTATHGHRQERCPHRPVDTEQMRQPRGLTRELKDAFAVYRPGMTYRDLGKALKASDEQARTMWMLLKQRGLLHPQEEIRQETAARKPQPVGESALERALEAYDQGNRTVHALALALGMSPWNVRPLYTQVKKMREKAG